MRTKITVSEQSAKAITPGLEPGQWYQHDCEELYLLTRVGGLNYALVSTGGQHWSGHHDSLIETFDGKRDKFTLVTEIEFNIVK